MIKVQVAEHDHAEVAGRETETLKRGIEVLLFRDALVRVPLRVPDSSQRARQSRGHEVSNRMRPSGCSSTAVFVGAWYQCVSACLVVLDA